MMSFFESVMPPMKWIFALVLLAVSMKLAQAQETRIAAIVNDEVVSIDDLGQRLKLILFTSKIEDNPANRRRLEAQTLKTLIDEHLQLQEAKRLDIAVPPDEIEQEFISIEQQNNMKKGQLDDILKQAGVSRTSLASQIRASIAWRKLVRNRLSQDVNISDEEVSEAMEHIKENANAAQHRVAEIFLGLDNPTQDDEIHKLADQLIGQIRGGANFSAVARQFSQSPTAAVGGDLGWVTLDQLNPSVATAVERMKPGEMSYPIRTPGGYYMIYLIDRRLPGQNAAAETTLSIAQVVFPLGPNASEEERKRVEEQALEVSEGARSCGEMVKIGRDRSPQLSGQIPELRAGDLPPEIRSDILGLKIAEPSRPLPLRGGIGVVMVCERKDPENVLPTHEQVANALGQERLDTLARRYMRDLRRAAFVDYR
ncbi:MAG TPA: peptidylprolyl isomerase [Stellaceae bacterium]|nr:peptidylprolyl isomerase [Stellaceae bacterium]